MINWKIENIDILEWCKQYDGPQAHALLCDPPYHLVSINKRFSNPDSKPPKGGVYKRTSNGFMGSVWDSVDENGMGIAFDPATWAALSQHLYPGAFGMAFASSRGWHRLACAIEDAGLIIHPSLFGWSYLCLSEDTEILTNEGWKSYHQLLPGSICLCYNVNDKSLAYMPIEEVYIYDHDDTAYSIQSDSTDQIVTRNHRVIVERDGELIFREAHSLEFKESVPFLETVPDLSEAFCSDGFQPVLQKESLLPDLRYRSKQSKETGQINWTTKRQDQIRSKTQAQGSSNYMSNLWRTSLQTFSLAKKGENSILFDSLQWQGQGNSLGEKFCQMDRGTQASIFRENKRGWKSILERGSNLLQDAWQLYKRQVCEMSSRIFRNGPQGWLYNGASVNGGSIPGATLEAFRGSTSRQPRSSRQPSRESNAIQQQLGTQEIRGNRQPSTTLATVTPIHYKGKVWCVRTPTGTFVARRNGHIFITGNSGFPKATRIDTQIDKMNGVEVRHGAAHPAFAPRKADYRTDEFANNGHDDELKHKAQSPLAQEWAGHRYGLQALKPALEPIIVFQKPYDGRPVDSIVATGAGALNIDGGRIGTGELVPGGGNGKGNYRYGDRGNYSSERLKVEPHNSGRWPANFLLSHSPLDTDTCHESCPVRLFDEQSGNHPGGSPKTGNEPGETHKNVYGKKRNRIAFDGYDDSASRMFHRSTWQYEVAEQLANAEPVRYEPKVSSNEREAGLDGLETTTRHRVNAGGLENEPRFAPTQVKNNHPTLKPISLTKYLATLLLPPDTYAPRRILIPFCGVASEYIGAMLAGWEEIVGIEREENYVRIAEARLKWWSQWPGWGQTDVDKILASQDSKAQSSFF